MNPKLDDFWIFKILVLGITLSLTVTIGVMGILTVFCISIARAECGSRFRDFEHRYELIGGCLIKVDGKWIPDDAYYYEGKQTVESR